MNSKYIIENMNVFQNFIIEILFFIKLYLKKETQ